MKSYTPVVDTVLNNPYEPISTKPITNRKSISVGLDHRICILITTELIRSLIRPVISVNTIEEVSSYNC